MYAPHKYTHSIPRSYKNKIPSSATSTKDRLSNPISKMEALKKKKDIQKTVPLYSTAGKWRPGKNIDVCIYII
jgi:hypothetical protein